MHGKWNDADGVAAELARAGVDPAIVDDVVWGCVGQVGDQSSNIARYSVLASTTTAASLGWSVNGWQLLVDDPDGPITPETEGALREALATPGIHFQVERGFVPEPQPVLWLIAGTLALLAVIGAAMSTILAAAELRPFLATFAAVGAPPTLTRRQRPWAEPTGARAAGEGPVAG